jgi:hypothetical protein
MRFASRLESKDESLSSMIATHDNQVSDQAGLSRTGFGGSHFTYLSIISEPAAVMQISDSSTVKVEPGFIQYMREAWVKAS